MTNALIEAAMKQFYATPIPPVVLGKATRMKCCCGGLLHENPADQARLAAVVSAVCGPPPRHRKRRIQKKWMKAWAAKARVVILAGGPMQRPTFVCAKCSRREGFYGAVGRNLIQIESLPPGAVPIYTRDSAADG